jgi:phage FluMu gp28-like protein
VASRQVGKTEGLAGLAYSFALMYPESRIQIVSTAEKHAMEILSRVRWHFRNSLYRETLEFERDSTTEIWLRHNGSKIVSLPSNPDTLAGYSNHLVIVDEVAKIREWEEMRAALFPTVSQTNGKLLLSSSFKGKNHWWDLVMDPEWGAKVYPWWVNPSELIELMRRILPPAQFAEEYECVPVDEFHSLFPYELIEQISYDELEEFFF